MKLLTDCNTNINQIIKDQKTLTGIFSTKSILFRCQLKDIYMLNDMELENFFVTFNQEIQNTTPEIGIFKLLPILSNFLNYGKLLHIVQLLLVQIISKFLKCTNNCNDNNNSNDLRFQFTNHTQLKDIIFKLFESSDRITRISLLNNVFLFIILIFLVKCDFTLYF